MADLYEVNQEEGGNYPVPGGFALVAWRDEGTLQNKKGWKVPARQYLTNTIGGEYGVWI